MAEVATPTTEPSYITNLALSAAPFNDSQDAKLFFKNGQAGHRLNLLLHLIYAGDKVANLCAGEGLGKTSLLNQLPLHLGDEVKLCFLDANQHSDSTTILAKCLVDLDVDNSEILAASQPVIVLKQRLEQLDKLGIKVILLFDNSDRLDATTLTELSSWLTWQLDGKNLLGAVFASQNVIELYGEAKNRYQEIDLPPMAETEAEDYLLHRLRSVGFQQTLPFSGQVIKHIYQLSSGNPARLNQLAHQQLLGFKKIAVTSPVRKVMEKLSRWYGLVLILFAPAVLVLFQDEINGLFERDGDTPSNMQQELELIPAPEPLATVQNKEDLNVTADAQRDELESLLAEIPGEKLPELTNKHNEQPINQDLITASFSDGVLGMNWIAQQAATNYTFQLMGSWDREEVDEFINKYALAGDIAVFESLRNGRVWHVLIFGSFIDKDTALTISKQWPAPLNTLPSWLRRFDSVQKQIKDNAVAD